MAAYRRQARLVIVSILDPVGCNDTGDRSIEGFTLDEYEQCLNSPQCPGMCVGRRRDFATPGRVVGDAVVGDGCLPPRLPDRDPDRRIIMTNHRCERRLDNPAELDVAD